MAPRGSQIRKTACWHDAVAMASDRCRVGVVEGTMAVSEVPAKLDVASAHPYVGLQSRRDRVFSKFETGIAAYAAVEAVSVVFAAILAKIFYIDFYLSQNQSLGPYLVPAALLAVTLYLFLKQAGLYDIGALVGSIVGYGKLWGALAISMLIVLGTLYISKTAEDYSRGWFLTWFALSAATLVAVRVAAMRRFRHMISTGRLRRRMAIFGSLEFITAMKAEIENADPSSVVAGQYLARPAAVASADELAINGGLLELKDAIARDEFDSILIGLPAQDTARIQSAVNSLASYSTELLLCTELEPYPVVVHGSRNFGSLRTNVVNLVPTSESNGFVKVVLDYAVALVALCILAPVMLVAALAIKIDSPGPVFFRQRRYGRNNGIFRIMKFRTMTVAEDGADVKQAERNDPRVTRVGRFLRRTSIDELPQLFNVLTGDMSIVGPRPHALAHDHLFEQQLDLFSRRRRVRPGLTGWAQVHGFRGETKRTEDIRSRMQHDLYYIDNWSIWLDIEIISRTALVLFRSAY